MLVQVKYNNCPILENTNIQVLNSVGSEPGWRPWIAKGASSSSNFIE